MNEWTYKGKIFTSEMINDYYGFVYEITNTKTGKLYLGRKYFHSHTHKKQKGKKRKLLVVKESDWKKYYGSCDALKQDILVIGQEFFTRKILKLCKSKMECNYQEVAFQFKADVLFKKDKAGNRLYYNDNIMNRFYSKNIG